MEYTSSAPEAPTGDRFAPPANGVPAYDGTLFGTEQLNAEEVERLRGNRPGRLVVFLGEQGSGKTSLCIELYERQRRGDTGARFAGSWTLLALEQLAHRRRTTGDVRPTRLDELGPDKRVVLHLALRTGEVPLHLLFADLPGEVFRALADNQIAISAIPWLGRADKLVVLVDGTRLVDVETRSPTVTRARQLLERLRVERLPRPGTRLSLLVTRWDAVHEDPVALSYWLEREPELLADALALDDQAVALYASATPDGPDGLAALRAWLLEAAPTSKLAPAYEARHTPPSKPPAYEAQHTPRSEPPALERQRTPPSEQPAYEPQPTPPSEPPAYEPQRTQAPHSDAPAEDAQVLSPALPAIGRFEWPAEEQRFRWRPWRRRG